MPGQVIPTHSGYMRGHGTTEENGQLIATVCGLVEQVSALIYVRPLRSRYVGEVGDVIVGRVDEIGNGRWYVEVCSSQRAQLHLAAINLPGSVQRRRTEEDEKEMRRFLAEGDILSTEVQRVQSDGLILLHTRSAKYGKLENGCLVQVPPQLVRRQASHMVNLPCEPPVGVVLGNNGYIWVGLPQRESARDTINYALGEVTYQAVSPPQRQAICRVRNCIAALSAHYLQLTPQSIMDVYSASVRGKLEVSSLTNPEVVRDLIREYIKTKT